MDVLKKAVLLVTLLSISVFMAGCGGDEEAADTEAQDAAGQADSAGGGAMDDLIEKIEEAQEEKAEEE